MLFVSKDGVVHIRGPEAEAGDLLTDDMIVLFAFATLFNEPDFRRMMTEIFDLRAEAGEFEGIIGEASLQ